jgi:aspartyl-tRNA(Asn)/glutamyl-tRNA(Gln) amidotransferase subunit C
MPVTRDDVNHVARLARLGVAEERVGSLVAELNGILSHMDALARVDAGEFTTEPEAEPGGPLRPDEGPAVPLARDIAGFAPAVRDGFFLVPRLATHHGTAGADTP